MGHLAEIRYLAGVALATVIFNVVYWSFGFLRMGTTGLTAQARGREDRTELWLILLRGGLVADRVRPPHPFYFQVPIRDLGFALLSAEPEVKAAGAMTFLMDAFGVPPAVLTNLVLMGWFSGARKGALGHCAVLNWPMAATLCWITYSSASLAGPAPEPDTPPP